MRAACSGGAAPRRRTIALGHRLAQRGVVELAQPAGDGAVALDQRPVGGMAFEMGGDSGAAGCVEAAIHIIVEFLLGGRAGLVKTSSPEQSGRRCGRRSRRPDAVPNGENLRLARK